MPTLSADRLSPCWRGPIRPPAAPASAARTSSRRWRPSLGDAIARAEPSVVAIAREKAEDDETMAVRGREPVPNPRPTAARSRRACSNLDPFGDDLISFDYGSGVVIGDEGEILTAFHVVKGAQRLDVRAVGRQAFDGRDHRRRPAERPGRDRPRARCPGIAAPKLKPIAHGRCHASSARGRSWSRWATRSTPRATAGPRRAGASSRTSRGGSSRRPRNAARSDSSSATTRPCSSSTPSSTWG